MDMNGLQTWKLSSTPCLLLIIPNFPRKKEEQIMNCPLFGFDLQKCPPRSLGEKTIQPFGCFLWYVVTFELKIPLDKRFLFNQTYPFSHKHSSVENHVPNERKISENIYWSYTIHFPLWTTSCERIQGTNLEMELPGPLSLGGLKPPRSKVYDQNSVIWVEEMW